MWTVTLALRPVVVTAHLLGGMSTLALLVWLLLPPSANREERTPETHARLALVAVIAQIALGGWVSSNYAALICHDFPTCLGAWVPDMDFRTAFTLHRELGRTGTGDFLPGSALIAIHWTHRVGALVVALLAGTLALRLLRPPAWTSWGIWIGLLLLVQIGLGIANVLLLLPLHVAVAHNTVAAMLLASLVALNARLRRDGTASVPKTVLSP